MQHVALFCVSDFNQIVLSEILRMKKGKYQKFCVIYYEKGHKNENDKKIKEKIKKFHKLFFRNRTYKILQDFLQINSAPKISNSHFDSIFDHKMHTKRKLFISQINFPFFYHFHMRLTNKEETQQTLLGSQNKNTLKIFSLSLSIYYMM